MFLKDDDVIERFEMNGEGKKLGLLKTQLLAVFFPKFSDSINFGDEHH